MGWGSWTINLMPKDKMRLVTMSHIVTWNKNIDCNQVDYISYFLSSWFGQRIIPFFPVGENKQKLEK